MEFDLPLANLYPSPWPDIAGYTPGSDVTKHANLDLDRQALVRALEHPDPPPPPTWTQPFEWIGVFDTSGDTTHTWLAQKVDGKYADPTMKLVMIATHTPTAATMESLEGDAAVLIEGNCTDVSSGATLTPTTSGVCYNLMFDSASEDSTFTLNTAGVAGIVFAAVSTCRASLSGPARRRRTTCTTAVRLCGGVGIQAALEADRRA